MQKIVLVCVLALVVAGGCATPYSELTSPLNLGPNVNTQENEGSPDISADGMTLYFDAQARPGGVGGWDIWMSKARTPHHDFGPAMAVPTPVNSPYNESGPCISEDGLTLYFASDRPGGSGGFDLWVSTRKTVNDPWPEPVNLGPTVNSQYGDNHPSISADGLTLYFDSRRPSSLGGLIFTDIYMCRRLTTESPWGKPELLAINTEGNEYSPDLTHDRLRLYYDSPLAGRDLWVAERATPKDEWEKGVPLGLPFNASGIDTDPSVSADGRWLYFVSDRPGGRGGFDLWLMSVPNLKNKKEERKRPSTDRGLVASELDPQKIEKRW
jgi:Tol biopolymer transport system component